MPDKGREKTVCTLLSTTASRTDNDVSIDRKKKLTDRWLVLLHHKFEPEVDRVVDCNFPVATNQDNTTKTPKGRKRTKSFSDVDNTNSTPAMMEVMRLKKLKSMDDANDELTNSETPVVALLKLPFKLSPVTITKEILEEGSDAFQPPTEIKRRKTSKNKELKRLENFNPDVLERRRTRSDAVAESTKTQREIRSNLRSAFNYGIAPVRNFMRSVSSSLPKIF